MTGASDMDAETRVQLTRIEGKLDLVNERHAAMREDIGEIKQTQADFSRRTDERFHHHGVRLQVIESKNLLSEGERSGVRKSVTILWTLAGLGSGGVGTALLVHFLHL